MSWCIGMTMNPVESNLFINPFFLWYSVGIFKFIRVKAFLVSQNQMDSKQRRCFI